MATQHVVTGSNDNSLAKLADMYGVSANAISQVTFGGTGATLIYPWLRDNGGDQMAKAPAVPTGWHWAFSRGMVVNIPDPATESKSPPSYANKGSYSPGGPKVTIYYPDAPSIAEGTGESGAPSTGRESWNEEGETVAADEPPAAEPETGSPALAATGGGLSFTTLLILGVIGFIVLGGGKKGKKKTTRRRSPKRRKSRRRR